LLLVRFGRSMVHLKAENPPFHNCASKNSDWQDFQLERHWLHPSSQSWLWHQHPDETPISAIVNWSEKNEGITDRIKTNEKALKNIRKPANHTYHADSVVVLAQNTVWEELPREKGEKLQRKSAAGESIDLEPKKHQKTKKERSLVNWLLKKCNGTLYRPPMNNFSLKCKLMASPSRRKACADQAFQIPINRNFEILLTRSV
jgi:hypothetical protein